MRFLDQLLYYIVLGWFRLLSLFPLWLLFLLSEIITFLVYRLIGYRKKVVFTNLKLSFPEKSEEEIKHISRKYFRHMSVMIVENIYLRFVSVKKFESMLVLENKELFEKYYQENRNLIVMLGHYGNWEFGAGIMRLIDYNGAAVYKRLSSKIFDKIYYDIRSRLGAEPIEMHNVFRTVIKKNKQKEPYILFMVADQSPQKNDPQHWITFLNQETGVYTGSEKLAKRFNMPVIYMELRRIKKGSYKIICTLLTDKPQETKDNEITEMFYRRLEESIKNGPRFWLWSHKRWKNKRLQ